METDSNSHKTEPHNMPSVESSDPEERKMARRMRIQARLEAAVKEQAIAEGTYEEPQPEQPLIEQAIENSEDALTQLYFEGTQQVTNIMVASDAREVARREAEEEERNERLEKLKEDSASALKKLDDISQKWEAIMDLNGPLELFENMKEQKAKCLELIEQKNELIKSFQMELRMADEKFMKGQRTMYEELALLTRRIDEVVLLMKKAYRIELGNIQESIDVSRTELMEKHQKIWQNLYLQREKQEVSNMGKKFKVVESFHEEYHKLHVEHDEKYREMRINLETDIQILEQELEQVKALCLLNSEKLDYNYQVLKKREEENLYIKNHQKRRLNKLQDLVNTLKKKIDEKRQQTDVEYKKLTKEVARYYRNILETEKKAEQFAVVNDEKYNNIWSMKDEEAKDLMDKIFTADMIIHEQILGVEWIPPTNSNFNRMDMIAYRTAVNAVDQVKKIKQRTRKKSPDPIGSCGKDLRENELSDPEVLAGHKRLLSTIFELLADQSGFLMEEKLDELLQPYTEDEKTIVRLDNVFMAIGIKTQDDLDIVKKIFLPYAVCLLCDKSYSLPTSSDVRIPRGTPDSRDQSLLHIRELEEKVSKLRVQAKEGSGEPEEETQHSADRRKSLKDSGVLSGDTVEAAKGQSSLKCNITHPLVIEKIYILRALRDFVSFYHAHRIEHLEGIESKLMQHRITISRLLSQGDVFAYWHKYKEAIPPKLHRLWRAVSEALNRYLTVLKERHELNIKAQELRRQNLDLKRLLSYYKIPESCGNSLRLPVILPVPNEPIPFQELMTITRKISF